MVTPVHSHPFVVTQRGQGTGPELLQGQCVWEGVETGEQVTQAIWGDFDPSYIESAKSECGVCKRARKMRGERGQCVGTQAHAAI